MKLDIFNIPIHAFKIWFDSSIKNRMIVYFSLLFFLVMSLVGFYVYKQSSDTLVQEIIKETNKTLEQTSRNIDYYFADMKDTALFVSLNPTVERLLSSQELEWKDRVVSMRANLELISGIIRMKPYLSDIIIAGKNGYSDNGFFNKELDYQHSLYDQQWLRNELNKESEPTVRFISLHETDYYLSNSDTPESKTVSVLVITANGRGVVLCDLKLADLNKQILSDDQGHGGVRYVVDGEGKIIMQSNAAAIGESLDNDMKKLIDTGMKGNAIIGQDGHQLLVVYSTLPTSGWKVVTTIPMEYIHGKSNPIRNIIFTSILIAILLVILTSILISTTITRSIHRLASSMNRIDLGYFHIPRSESAYGEVAVLERKYAEMIKRIETLIQDVYERELRQKEAEFNLLQSQINPHFLFNTLQLVKAEAVLGQTLSVSKMITALGYMLRYAMYKSKMVLLKEEVDYIEHYFAIFSHRYGSNREFTMDIDERALNFRVPKLLLQPIVENSMIHGLGQKDGKGSIRVEVLLREEEVIKVVIRDDGIGMTVDKLNAIQESLLQESDRDTDRIGLNNINRRIKMTYGDRFGLQIFSEFGKFTEVTLLFPAKHYLSEDQAHV